MSDVAAASSATVRGPGRVRVWHKLALVLVTIGLVPVLLGAWLIAEGDARRIAEGARAYHLATAEVALGEARSLVARALTEARTLGELVARSDEPPERREALIRAQLVAAELVDDMAVYDPRGAPVMVLRTFADRERWTPPQAISPSFVEVATRDGRALLGAAKNPRGAMLLDLLVPAWRGDALHALVVVAIDLSPLSRLVADLGRRHFDAPERVRLVDGDVRVIAAADSDSLGRSLAGTALLAAVTGPRPFDRDIAYTVDYRRGEVDLIGAVVPLPELGWAAIVEEDQDEAYAAVDATWRTAAVIGAVVALLALIIALVLGRRLARPVEAMAAATARVADGDFAVRVPVTRGDEIGATAAAFNRMARDLGSYRERLVGETRARDNLSRFLSPEVVERIVQGREALALGGERREVTVLFADVVSFTSLAEEREPEVAVAILNELFTIVTEIVFQHGGIIDKFIGDCVMAIWGAPEAHADDPRRAVRAAEAMLRWLEVGNAKWRKQIGRDIQLAIGVHTGLAVVGNIGSERRMDYTAIGDAVHVAARLERLARPNQILVTRETMQRVGDEFPSQSLGTYDIIGRARPSEIFVLGE